MSLNLLVILAVLRVTAYIYMCQHIYRTQFKVVRDSEGRSFKITITVVKHSYCEPKRNEFNNFVTPCVAMEVY